MSNIDLQAMLNAPRKGQVAKNPIPAGIATFIPES
jgi:hypothetical protein